MYDSYICIVGSTPKIKEAEGYKSDFQMRFLDGDLDLKHLHKMHNEATHNIYLQSWLKSKQGLT